MAHSYKGYYTALSRQRKRIVTAMGRQYGSIVQLVRMLACHARGRGFEPRWNRQEYPVHQAHVYLVQLITFTRYPVRDVSAMDEVFRTLGLI